MSVGKIMLEKVLRVRSDPILMMGIIGEERVGFHCSQSWLRPCSNPSAEHERATLL
jgi:hypothetical protein